jgi:phosphatidylcholine synthase
MVTAAGALFGLAALRAIAEGEYRRAFLCMGGALLVDAVDGTLARRLKVARTLPSIDGALLDNIVDYFNYALVPAFLLLSAPVLPLFSRPWAAAAICLAAAYQFSHIEAKRDGRYFRGFPSYWNVVAFYLVLLRPGPVAALSLVALLALLSFLPTLWVYPSRTPECRGLTLALTVIWIACTGLLVLRYPEPARFALWGSLAYVCYYAGLSALLTWRLRFRPYFSRARGRNDESPAEPGRPR